MIHLFDNDTCPRVPLHLYTTQGVLQPRGCVRKCTDINLQMCEVVRACECAHILERVEAAESLQLVERAVVEMDD